MPLKNQFCATKRGKWSSFGKFVSFPFQNCPFEKDRTFYFINQHDIKLLKMFEEIVNLAYLELSSLNKLDFEKLEIIQQK